MRLLRFDVMRLFGYLIKRPYSLICVIRIKKLVFHPYGSKELKYCWITGIR
jgi:hypothetical protein